MGLIRHEHIQSFNATDCAGQVYRIDVYQDFEVLDMSSGTERLPLIKSLKWKGNSVNWIEKGKYKVVGYEIELTSDDPNAP